MGGRSVQYSLRLKNTVVVGLDTQIKVGEKLLVLYAQGKQDKNSQARCKRLYPGISWSRRVIRRPARTEIKGRMLSNQRKRKETEAGINIQCCLISGRAGQNSKRRITADS